MTNTNFYSKWNKKHIVYVFSTKSFLAQVGYKAKSSSRVRYFCMALFTTSPNLGSIQKKKNFRFSNVWNKKYRYLKTK